MSLRPKTASFLRTRELRATAGRVAVLEALIAAQKPVSAEELHRDVRSIDLVTVYRTLQRFLDASLVRAVRFKDTTVRYELAKDTHHHHLQCTRCGIVDELPDCGLPLNRLALKRTKKFAAIEEHSLEFFGTCVSCAKG